MVNNHRADAEQVRIPVGIGQGLPASYDVIQDPSVDPNQNRPQKRRVVYAKGNIGGRPVYYGHLLFEPQDMKLKQKSFMSLNKYAYGANVRDSLQEGDITAQDAVRRIGNRDVLKQGDLLHGMRDEANYTDQIYTHPLRIYDALVGQHPTNVPAQLKFGKKNFATRQQLQVAIAGTTGVNIGDINPANVPFTVSNFSRVDANLYNTPVYTAASVQAAAAVNPFDYSHLEIQEGQTAFYEPGSLQKTPQDKKIGAHLFSGHILMPGNVATEFQELGQGRQVNVIKQAVKNRIDAINASGVNPSFVSGGGVGKLRKATATTAPVSDPNAFTRELRNRSSALQSQQLTRQQRAQRARQALYGLRTTRRYGQGEDVP